MPDVMLPFPEAGRNEKETVVNLYDTVIKFRKELEFLLQNLNEENVMKAAEALVIKDSAGNVIVNEYGIDPEKEIWSPNLWCNSDMCVYDPDTLLPRFISGSGVVISNDAVYVGQKSMKIPVGITSIYTPEAAVGASTINPQWLTAISTSMYLAFYAKFTGGNSATLTVQVYDQSAGANLTITDVDGNTGTSLSFTRSDWDEEIIFVKFNSGAFTDIRPKITNNSASYALYCNGMQVCADINGKYPQPYIRGKFSVGTVTGKAVELMSDIALYVQDDEPTDAVEKDVWIDTNDYSRYDSTNVTTNITLLVSDNEVIYASGAITITLHAGTSANIIKKIYNVGTGLITIAGTINGVVNMYLYPAESVELITDGTNWRC